MLMKFISSKMPMLRSSGTGRSLIRLRHFFGKQQNYDTFQEDNNEAANDVLSGYKFKEDEKDQMLQAVVFIEDAIQYRSVYHKTDRTALKLHQFYYSTSVQVLLMSAILVIHLLAFVEYPSSITVSSDPRYVGRRPELRCGVTEAIEFLCIIVFSLDLCFKIYMIGIGYFFRKRWLVAYLIILILYSINLVTTLSLLCSQNYRFRRLFRPFFLLQSSTLMKKTVRCVKSTLPEIASVLLLLLLHLFFFAMLGVLILPDNEKVLNVIISPDTVFNVSFDASGSSFNTLAGAFYSLFVLITTANNPNLMIPWYKHNRLYAIYFVSYMIIGVYCLMNMLTAITYNQFRGYFLDAMQSSVMRRKVGIQAAFEVLKDLNPLKKESSFLVKSESVSIPVLRRVLLGVILNTSRKCWLLERLNSIQDSEDLDVLEFHDFFRLLERDRPIPTRPAMKMWQHPILLKVQGIMAHKYTSWLSFAILSINVICISVELSMDYKSLMSSSHSLLALLDLIFITYYVIEQMFKVIFIGFRHYFWNRVNIFDFVMTIALCIFELIFIIMYGLPFIHDKDAFVLNKYETLWTIVRIINIIILCRLLRLIFFIRSMVIVTSVLVDIVQNLRAFIGILVVAYYTFAIIGLEVFQGTIINLQKNENSTPGLVCESYEQYDFWSHNFDDFGSSIMVLWDVMVVNNWSVFASAYARATRSRWAYFYFILWNIVSLVFCMNLLTAFILENFIMKWDRLSHDSTDIEEGRIFRLSSLHDMFRNMVKEPSTQQLHEAVLKHRYLFVRSGSHTSEPTTSFR